MIHTFNKRLLFLLLLSCASCVMAQTDLYNRYSGRTDVRVASVNQGAGAAESRRLGCDHVYPAQPPRPHQACTSGG